MKFFPQMVLEPLKSSNIGLLHETKHMFSSHFDRKDLEEATYVLGIQILHVRSKGVLGFSQRMYIDRVLKIFNLGSCSPTNALIVEGNKLSKALCPQNDDGKNQMKVVPYASTVGTLMYAQACTRPDITFVVGMLGKYLNNLGLIHLKAIKS